MAQELVGEHAGVAVSHIEALRTARRVLEKGGNCIDAAVAATLVIGVVMPGQTGIGGYGGNLVHYDSRTGRVTSIDFDSRAPKAYRDDLYGDEKTRFAGYRAMGVPAVVAGLDLALRTLGTTSWRDLSQDAIRLAEEGAAVDEIDHQMLVEWAPIADPVSLKAFLPDGKVPALGEKLVQPDLAKLLRKLADEGPQAFYHGEIPKKIVAQVQAHGGVLTEDDFHATLAQQVDPLHITYREHDLYVAPLPSGGLTTLQILKALERFDFSKIKPWSAEHAHLFAEAAKRCWNDRLSLLGDPQYAKVPVETLLSDAHADEIAKEIRSGKIYTAPTTGPFISSHTGSFCCCDAKRNLCTLTSTHGGSFGSTIVIEGLGLPLNNAMSRFNYDDRSPNHPTAGKRMFHNMCPLIATRDGHPVAAFGHVGGPSIVNITAQMAMGVIDFHLPTRDIALAPRLHTEGQEPLEVTNDFPDESVKGLEQRGHKLTKEPEIGGVGNVVIVDHFTDQVHAASKDGVAETW